MKKKRYSGKLIAIGGVLSAAALTIMLMGSIIPFATYSVPALASLCVLFMRVEFGSAAALLSYASISLLSLLLAPDKEIALLFICYFGYYPNFKTFAERKLRPRLAFLAKWGVFNASSVGMYLVVTQLLVIKSVLDEFSSYSSLFIAVLLVLGNVVFVIYDFALTKLLATYFYRLRGKLGIQ